MSAPPLLPQRDFSEPIRTERLELIPLGAPFLDAVLGGDHSRASALLRATVPDEWPGSEPWVARRLNQLRQDPSLEPWLLRAIVLSDTAEMVGHVGFHSRPGPEYLDDYLPGGVEFGYTVFERWRRNGFAREAVEALMDWARRHHGVTRFVVAIGPENLASLALARGLGFRRIGSHIDDEDGPEEILGRDFLD